MMCHTTEVVRKRMTADEVVAIDLVDRIKDWSGGAVCDTVDVSAEKMV